MRCEHHNFGMRCPFAVDLFPNDIFHTATNLHPALPTMPCKCRRFDSHCAVHLKPSGTPYTARERSPVVRTLQRHAGMFGTDSPSERRRSFCNSSNHMGLNQGRPSLPKPLGEQGTWEPDWACDWWANGQHTMHTVPRSTCANHCHSECKRVGVAPPHDCEFKTGGPKVEKR